MPCRDYVDEHQDCNSEIQKLRAELALKEKELCDTRAMYCILLKRATRIAEYISNYSQCQEPLLSKDVSTSIEYILNVSTTEQNKVIVEQLKHRQEDRLHDLKVLSNINQSLKNAIKKILELGGEPKKDLYDKLKESESLILALKGVDDQVLISDRNYGLGNRLDEFFKIHAPSKLKK